MVVALLLTAAASSGLAASGDTAPPKAASDDAPPSNTTPAAPGKPPGKPLSKTQSKPAAKPTGKPTRYSPNRFAGRAGIYYKTVWGVDDLSVKLTESGQIVRFSWRVLDPALAMPLSNKESQPMLVDPQAGVSLVVPTLENIGMMRQAQTPQAGKLYWMAFSNKGRVVKKGDRVNVVVGQFHADGLGVDD